MRTRDYKNGSIMGGISLIALGLVFFVATQANFDLNWGRLWPVFVVLGGVAPLTRAFSVADPRTRGGYVVGGTMCSLLGVYFFLAMSGILSWALWPVYPLIIGVALLSGYLASGLQDSRYLLPGVILSVIGVAFLGVLTLGDYTIIGKIWPVFLIIGGVVMLIAPRAGRTHNS